MSLPQTLLKSPRKMGPRKYRRNFFFDGFHGKNNIIVHDLGLCITARPAPRTPRPLAGLPNPYPYGCSVLCNHPRDPELKDVVWRPRIATTHEGVEHYDNTKAKRTSRTGSSSDGGSFVFQHNWEQKINALGTLVEVRTHHPTATATQIAIRRCASGGPSPIERRPKTEGMLVLDLRPWKSFDNVSSIADGQHDTLDNFERFELTSPRTREKPGRSTRPIRPRPETFSSKPFKEGRKVPKQMSSKTRGPQQRNSDVTDQGNVISGYDTNRSDSTMHEMDLDDSFSRSKMEDEQGIREPKTDESFVNGAVVQQPSEERVATQTNSLEELEENLRNIQVGDNHENDNDALNQIEDPISVEDMAWLYFPRAGNTFGARFELPIDLRKLKTMTPLEYLSNYVVATRCRMRLNDVVFERHSTASKLPVEKLLLSVTEILGFHLDSQSEDKLSSLIDLASVTELSREQFAGIGALAERIGRSGISQRDDLELADFNLLQQKMSYLEMGQCLRRLILFICENDQN